MSQEMIFCMQLFLHPNNLKGDPVHDQGNMTIKRCPLHDFVRATCIKLCPVKVAVNTHYSLNHVILWGK